MKYKVDQVIRFKEDRYLILDVIVHENTTYLYLINESDFKDDISIVKVLENGELGYIYDEKEFEYIMNRIFIDNEEALLDFASE